MTAKFGLRGATGVIGPEEAVHKAIQTLGHHALADQTGLTDNSGGSAIATRILLSPATQVNTAATGSDQSTAATLLASLDAVGDAMSTILAVADTLAALLDTYRATDSSGFTDGTGTIAAIGDGGTATTIGPQATEVNASVVILMAMMAEVIACVNPLARATGQIELTWATDDNALIDGTVAAITNAVGSAADPGILEVDADALMVLLEDNIATIAAVINNCTTYVGPQVVAV